MLNAGDRAESGLNARELDGLVTVEGVSAAALYAVRDKRLHLVGASHRNPERAESFEAAAHFVRDIALSAADLRTDAARKRAVAKDRYVATSRHRRERLDRFLLDDLEWRLAVPIAPAGRCIGVLMLSGDQGAIDRIERSIEHGMDLGWTEDLTEASLDQNLSWDVPAIGELSSGLASVATRDELATEVLDAGLDAVGASAGSLMLMTRPGVYELVQSRNIDRRTADRWAEFAEVAGRDPFSDAIVERAAQFFSSVGAIVDRYPHLWEDVSGAGHHSWAVVPFVAHPEGPVGAFGAIFDEPQEFDRSQRVAIRSVAHLAASTATRVEARRSSDATLRSLSDHLLDMNGDTSHTEHLVTSGFYLPAGVHSIAGGDWFDVIDGPNSGKVYAVLGDVADHGPSAVGTMVAVRSWIRGGIHDGLDPADIAAKVSNLVADYGYAATTIVVAAIEPEARRVTWCSAGHPPPLFADDDQVTLSEERHGPPLGTKPSPTAHYRQSTQTFDRATSLTMYSDGLLQQYVHEPEAGFDALRATVRRLRSTPFSASDVVAQYSGPLRYSTDDVAVLVIHFTDASGVGDE